ncbi:hypothetical protein BASA81_001094 [Batrachochytrium salamandrivorans]|nr:hypothetical protein BASA81_001094 [Batrachochytrium salamandrivorans]
MKPASFVVFHEPSHQLITCAEKHGEVGLEFSSAGQYGADWEATFPPLPRDALLGQAVMNQPGTLLAISTLSKLVVVLLNNTTPVSPLVEQVGNDGEWILGNATGWGMRGKLNRERDKFKGQLTGPVQGHLELNKDFGNEWAGTLQEGDGEVHLIRFQFNPQTKSGVFQGQQFVVNRVGDFCEGFLPVDVCFHAVYSRSHLVVLDIKSRIRLYNVLSNPLMIENQVNVNTRMYGGDVIKITFLEGGTPSTEFWPFLVLYALCRNGTILAICPIAKPSVPRNYHHLREDNVARQEFLQYGIQDNTLFPSPVIQLVDVDPKSPEQRYEHLQESSSEAVDFKLSKLETTGAGIMIHRTWTCGRMDVLFAPKTFRVDPVFRISRLDILLKREAAGKAGGPFSALASKLTKTVSMVTEGEEEETRGQDSIKYACGYDTIELIRCVEMFTTTSTRLPYLYTIKSDPLAFLCVDSTSNDPVLFRATWASPLVWQTTSSTLCPQVDATRLEMFGPQASRRPQVYSDPNSGVHVAVGPLSHFEPIDLTLRLRLLGAVAMVTASDPLPKETLPLLKNSSASVSDAHDFAQYRKDLVNANMLFQHLQQGLNDFAQTPIPAQLLSRSLDTLDEDTAFACATWLSDNFDWSANAETSLTARLMDSHHKLAATAVQQEQVFIQIQDQAAAWKQWFVHLEVEQEDMDKDIAGAKLLVVDMKLQAMRALKRAQHLAAKASPEDMALINRIALMRNECQVLLTQANAIQRQLESIASVVNKPMVLLNEPEPAHESIVIVNQLEKVDWLWESATQLAEEALVLAKHLPTATAAGLSEPPVLLVFCGSDLPYKQECIAALEAYRPIRVNLSELVMSEHQQRVWRKELRVMYLPLEVPGVGKIVLVPGSQVLFRCGDLSLHLEVDLRLASEVVVGQYVEVKPRRFAEDGQHGVFAYCTTGSNPNLRALIRRANRERVVAAWHV